MNNKQSIKLFEKVLLVFSHEKQLLLQRVASVNKVINNKLNYIAKIEQYRRDYDHANGIRLSHTIPSLMINFSNFISKMDISILNEKNAIERVKNEKRDLEMKVMQVEQKIKAIEVLLHSKLKAQKIHAENTAMEGDDALASVRQLRSSHE